jgi:hypothetical protein
MIRVECLLILFVLFKLMTNYVLVEGTHETFDFLHHLINSHIDVFVPTYRSLRSDTFRRIFVLGRVIVVCRRDFVVHVGSSSILRIAIECRHAMMCLNNMIARQYISEGNRLSCLLETQDRQAELRVRQ